MSLAAHRLGAYNPRQRYLSGGLGAVNPRRRYLTGLGSRGMGLRGFSPRALAGPGCTRCVSPLGQDIDAGALDDPLNLLNPDAGTPGLIPGTVMAPGDIALPGDITESGYSTTLPGGIISPTTGPTFPSGQSSASPIVPIVQAVAGAAPAIAYAAGKSPYGTTLPKGIVAQQAQPGTVAGIPTNYLIYGGLALLAAVVLGGMKK